MVQRQGEISKLRVLKKSARSAFPSSVSFDFTHVIRVQYGKMKHFHRLKSEKLKFEKLVAKFSLLSALPF